MKAGWSKPKVSIETANIIRERYLEGDSINSLSKRYDLGRHSIKCILRGETYNKIGEYPNLMENKKVVKLF